VRQPRSLRRLSVGDGFRPPDIPAAEAFGELKDPRAVEPLISALEGENSWVREEAAKALANITGKDFGEDDTKWESWWHENKGRFVK